MQTKYLHVWQDFYFTLVLRVSKLLPFYSKKPPLLIWSFKAVFVEPRTDVKAPLESTSKSQVESLICFYLNK